MSLYEQSVPYFTKMLTNLDAWLTKGTAYAQKKSFEPNVLASARLAPDQYPLVKQVQSACDAAKSAGARLTGKEPPKHPDTETTIDELHARIKTCIAYLNTLTPADFAGAESRKIALPFLEGKLLSAHAYLYELTYPNFYFHVTTAYAILRHSGVDLGKMDYIGGLTFLDA